MKKENILIITLILLGFGFFTFGIISKYALSEDLPNLIANVHAFEGFDIPAKSSFFLEGKPDFHATYSTAVVSLIKNIWSLHDIPLPFYSFFNETTKEIYICYIFFGFITIFLFITSAYIFSKQLFHNKTKAIIFVLLLIAIIEIPLIRWSGIISLHGMTFGSYYPQMFSTSFLFLFFYSLLKLDIKDKKKFYLCPLFAIVCFVSHPLTGIIAFSLGLFYVIREYFFRKEIYFIKSTVVLFFAFLISFLWPYVSFFDVINSVVPYYLLIFFLLIVLCVAFLTSKIKESQSLDIGDGYHNYILLGLLLTIGVIIYTLFNLKEYIYLDSIHYWTFSLFPFIVLGITLSFIYIWHKRSSFDFVIFFWFWGSVGIFLIGFIGVDIKVFWRFLFLSKIPSSLFIAYFLGEVSKHKKTKMMMPIISFILIISFVNMFYVVQYSNSANYFKNVPSEFKLGVILPAGSGLVLTDPYTGYFVSALTQNPVIAISENRISDYESEKNALGIDFLKKIYNLNVSCEDITLSNASIFLINNYISFEKREIKSGMNDYSSLISYLERDCGFQREYSSEKFVILGINK